MKLLLLTLLLVSCNSTDKAKNVIYFIGDGMGPASLTGSRIYKEGSAGKMNFESFPVVGISKTYSSNDYTTDSAASATALASGIKTYNGSIGFSDAKIDPASQTRKLQTIVDVAIKAGKSVGIITTTRVTHATPACFFAHAYQRSMEKEIAAQLKDSDINFLIGGGKKFFFNEEKGIDEISALKAKGWEYLENREQLLAYKPSLEKKVVGLFASSHLHYDIERQKDEAIATKEPTLAEMVDWGIKTLSQNPKGYLLVIESGRIDHAGHENNFQKQVHDTIALDAAYKVAFEGSDSETLIVSTSDHETGGLALSGYGDVKKIKGDNFLAVQEDKTLVTWATGPGVSSNDKGIEKKEKSVYYKEFANHSAVDVLILAKGPSQNLFAGFMKNSMIPIKILEAMGLKFDDSATVENQKSQANLK